MSLNTRPGNRIRGVATALLGAIALAAMIAPAAANAAQNTNQRYVVIMKGGYALNGTYALGQGYALATQEQTYALDGTYALGREYALYALDQTYALLDQYALTDEYEQTHDYALYGEYALDSGYALARDYALGSGYALASQALQGSAYALDDTYALTDDTAAYALGENYALLDAYALDENYALARDYALWAVMQADPAALVVSDLTRQAGVLMVESKKTGFAQALRGYDIVQEVGKDFGWKQFPTFTEAVNNGQLTVVCQNANTATEHQMCTQAAQHTAVGQPDPLESFAWDMDMIHTSQAHARQMGKPGVRVGIVDTGIDGNHKDFQDVNGNSNVDCQHGADFTTDGPGVGSPLACIDNNFHGTHTAGTIGARDNGWGVVGIAPNVTLVPIKVCDGSGSCYVSDTVEGIAYAGDIKLNVINMSFFVDDDAINESTEFKCQSDSTQRAYREAIVRSLHYARSQGVSLISALGNEDTNLASAKARGGKDCKVVPAMVNGVAGTVALGPQGEKASYSNWGSGWADISAPGGNGTTGDCSTTILSTLPGNLWGCIQGTSMASPHAAGVAALIISQFGTQKNGRIAMNPDAVYKTLVKTTVDIGAKGYDKCFGFGRIDAFRAARNDRSYLRDNTTPTCTEPD